MSYTSSKSILPLRRSIYKQFAQWLFTPLIIILFLATLVTILVSYQEQLSSQSHQRQQLLEAYGHSLSKPLWDCDDIAAKGIADSILQLSIVKGVEIYSACTKKTLASGIVQKTDIDEDDYFKKTLVFNDSMNRHFEVGTLDVYFYPSSIFKEAFGVLWRYIMIIVVMAISIAVGSMMAFRIIISRPLTAFHSAINTQTLARECEAVIRSLPPSKRNDELTDVVHAYDMLMDQLLEQKRKLQQQARKDPLTGLGNRIVLEEALKGAVHRAVRNQKQGFVLLIDLDEFKPINDTLGHAAGDFVLQAVAQRLLAGVRDVDTVTRLGGDEFVVVIDAHSAAEQNMTASEIVARLTKHISAPAEYEGTSIAIKASIGTACFPEDGLDSETLLARADLSMYAEKVKRKRPR